MLHSSLLTELLSTLKFDNLYLAQDRYALFAANLAMTRKPERRVASLHIGIAKLLEALPIPLSKYRPVNG